MSRPSDNAAVVAGASKGIGIDMLHDGGKPATDQPNGTTTQRAVRATVEE